MIYDNKNVRRQDRLLEDVQAMMLLKTGEYGVLSMVAADCSGYGIPINYVWDGKDAIYFHCAPVGEKIQYLRGNAKVCFSVVGKTEVVSAEFSTAYESVLLFGTIRMELPEPERMYALNLILDKYSPNDKVLGVKYAEKSFHRTTVLRMDIDRMSGKTKRIR